MTRTSVGREAGPGDVRQGRTWCQRRARGSVICLLLFAVMAPLRGPAAEAGELPVERPNFIVILCDNLGYGDIGCFGSQLHRTPAIDRMAREGLRLTSFYVSSGVCTPSRASLLTGCYPRRVNLHVSDTGGAVLRPVSPKGLHPREVTIAEVLKQRGYATAIVGKWHLGDQPALLPTRQGFDYFYGIPYSDDMTPRPQYDWPPLPLLEQESVVEAPVDRTTLTRRTTEKVVEFIEAHREQPFFVYFPHTMPGSTAAPFASERFRGRSKNGPYGDAVEEIDWSTGEILKALRRLELDRRTLVIWTSDNGAPRRNPPQGSNQPLGGWGYTTMEGGMRVPCVVRWPGVVPAGATSDALVTTMDLLPTLAGWSGADLPGQPIDGRDAGPLLRGVPGAQSPHEVFYYYHMEALQAVRDSRWKLRLGGGTPPIQPGQPPRLYDLRNDLTESRDLAASHPDIVARLQGAAEAARVELGDTGRPGRGQRPAGQVPSPLPLVKAE